MLGIDLDELNVKLETLEEEMNNDSSTEGFARRLAELTKILGELSPLTGLLEGVLDEKEMAELQAGMDEAKASLGLMEGEVKKMEDLDRKIEELQGR